MSIMGYLGPKSEELRLKAGDVAASEVPGLQGGDAAVLSGQFSLVEAQARAEQRAARQGEQYGSVGHYDPVLRAHCRLDKEG